MEFQEQNDFNEPVKLTVTEDVRSYIYETSKWTKFLSIVGFVFTGLIAMSAFSIGSVMQSMPVNPFFGIGSAAITVIMLLYALMVFYPSLLLFKYSNSAKQAILYGDQEALSVSASKMKSYFKYLGILTIIGLVIYLLSFLAVLAGLGMAAGSM